MKFLLNDEFAPITSEIGFLHIDHEAVAEEYLAWMHRHPFRPSRKLSKRPVTGDLRSVLNSLLPLGRLTTHYLFIPTVGEWSAYVNNGWHGSDINSSISYLAKRLKCRGVRVVHKPDTRRGKGREEHGRWGSMMLDVYADHPTEWRNLERSIALFNGEGRWKFETAGSPLPFEKIGQYQEKRVKGRFTFELFSEYLTALGLSPFEESFYLPDSKHPAILIEEELLPATKQITYTLEDIKPFL